MFNPNCGVYAIVSPSGRCYVGSSAYLRKRWSGHRAALKRGTHHSPALQRACDKYGLDALRFEVLLNCERSALVHFEQEQIDARRQEGTYNTFPNAGGAYGFVTSPETRAKQSLAKLGRLKSPETRQRMSEYSKARSPEHLAKLAAAQTGKSASNATREKQRRAKLGKRQTAEHIHNAHAALRDVVRRDNKAGVRGVSPAGSKWVARIRVAGVYKYLGTFATVAAAAEAVAAARK